MFAVYIQGPCGHVDLSRVAGTTVRAVVAAVADNCYVCNQVVESVSLFPNNDKEGVANYLLYFCDDQARLAFKAKVMHLSGRSN